MTQTQGSGEAHSSRVPPEVGTGSPFQRSQSPEKMRGGGERQEGMEDRFVEGWSLPSQPQESWVVSLPVLPPPVCPTQGRFSVVENDAEISGLTLEIMSPLK